MKAYSPDGSLIIGTKEIIHAVAMIATDSFETADGRQAGFDFLYSGESDVDWSDQETATKAGKRVFVDEDGEEWTEDQLVLKDEEEEAA